MPQALKPLSLIHIGKGKFSQLSLLALWGNKNWLPSMKVKELKIFQNKSGLKGSKWSSLIAAGTETPLSHSLVCNFWLRTSRWLRRDAPQRKGTTAFDVAVRPMAIESDYALLRVRPTEVLFNKHSTSYLLG